MSAPTIDAPAPAKPARRGPPLVHRGSRAHLVMIAAGLVVAVLAIYLGGNLGRFQQTLLTQTLIFAIAIAGLNIATGYTGLVSVGHSAFFGLGAYTTGVLIVRYGWQPIYTMPVAILVCFVVGLVVGLPALRIRGLYLAMVTLAFGVAFPELIARFDDLTGGSAGLSIRRRLLTPPDWSGFALRDKDIWLYWLAVVTLLIVMLAVHNLVRGRYGLALLASRDNEIAASASGINIAIVKTVSFGVSGAITGLGGTLFAMYIGNLYAEGSFTLLNAIALLTGLVIGGEATRFGPLVGAAAIVYIPHYTANWGPPGQFSAVLFGAILILIVFVVPEGITGGIARLIRRYVVRVVPAIPKPYVPPGQSPGSSPTP